MKYFSPFRVDNYKSHLTTQHACKWSEYQTINDNDDAIAKFFDTDVPFTNTLNAHFDIEKSQSFVTNKEIVEMVIGDMLFDAEDEDKQVTKERVLSIFTKNNGSDSYTFEIKNLRLYRLALRYIACGSTLWLCVQLLQVTKEETNLGYLGGATKTKMRQYVQGVVAICLQNISDAMKSAWTYSAAFDASTHQSTSYLDAFEAIQRALLNFCVGYPKLTKIKS